MDSRLIREHEGVEDGTRDTAWCQTGSKDLLQKKPAFDSPIILPVVACCKKYLRRLN
jgi:hypothetical protein